MTTQKTTAELIAALMQEHKELSVDGVDIGKYHENLKVCLKQAADRLSELEAAVTWRTDFENAPRDRSYIVAILKPDNKFLKSKMVAVRYFEEEDGWSMPGFGGMPDSWFQCFFIPPQSLQHKGEANNA